MIIDISREILLVWILLNTFTVANLISFLVLDNTRLLLLAHVNFSRAKTTD